MNKLVRGALGNLKHENMHLSKRELELLTKYANKEITEEEYDRQALKWCSAERSKQNV